MRGAFHSRCADAHRAEISLQFWLNAGKLSLHLVVETTPSVWSPAKLTPELWRESQAAECTSLVQRVQFTGITMFSHCIQIDLVWSLRVLRYLNIYIYTYIWSCYSAECYVILTVNSFHWRKGSNENINIYVFEFSQEEATFSKNHNNPNRTDTICMDTQTWLTCKNVVNQAEHMQVILFFCYMQWHSK